MTQPDVAATWMWTGDRQFPDWITHHHWRNDRPVINTADGPRTLYDGWMAILWTDGAITVASATVAERVYGSDGIAGRLARAETALARVQALADEHPAGIDTALIHEALDQTERGNLRDRLAATIDQAIEEDNLDNLTDFADRLSGAVLAAVTSHLDIGEEQAWCKYCRRAWNSPAHRCESDGERRVQKIADLRDRWLMAGPPPLGTPLARWWDKRLVELNAALNEEQPGPTTSGHVYLSTGCYHGDHAYCQSMTGLNGAKRPGVCKHCEARCICGCHQAEESANA